MIESIDIASIKNDVATKGYYILQTPKTIKIATAARSQYFSTFNQLPMRRGGFRYDELLAGPIRKQNISSSNGLGEAYAQVLQTVYYPKVNEFSAITEMFKLMVEIRNTLTEAPLDYGDNPAKEGMWNALRVHHYPRGGGFMVMHKDTHFPPIVGEGKFIQMLYLLSEKGVDFMKGGGVFIDLQGSLIDIEDVAGLGAIVFYDARIRHGVMDVDAGEAFSFEAGNGRLAAIANLYEYRG